MSDLLFAGVMGLIIGSFLNVCIYRLPRDLSVASPRRSFCPSCKEKISWYDNFPLFSFLILRGKCRKCQTPIPIRYPLVEALTAISFVVAMWQWGFSGETLRICIFSALLIALFFTDLETRILPDEMTKGGAYTGWILALLYPLPFDITVILLPESLPINIQSLLCSILGGVIPALGLWLIGELYLRIRKREGLGFGDVKMMLLLGAYLGLEKTVLTIIVGSVAGTVVGIVLLLWKGKEAARYELPFGSFLAAAALLIAYLPVNNL